MNNEFEQLNRDDVISIDPEDLSNLDISGTDRVVHLVEAILEYIGCDEIIDCEVLRLGARGWQKGKVRINLEFCPDQPSEPPSPLDDIRQTLKQAEIS